MQNIKLRPTHSVTNIQSGSQGPLANIVLSLLEKMTRGSLMLTLPDGQMLHFGNEPDGQRAKIHINNPNFFRRCVLFGDIGFGESYEAGEWDTDDVCAVISWMILNIENNPTISGTNARTWSLGLFKFINRTIHRFRDNSHKGSRTNIAAHYDLGNEFFALFLDPTMTYSAADFSEGNPGLETAQIRKYEKLCQSLRLKASDHLLEIGTGWGGFAIHAARQYGCRVTTVTISKEQASFARQRITQAGLAHQINVMLCDYRDIPGSYDKIVSIEMLEAVGARHLPTYFEVCHKALKPDGLLAIQVITCPDSRFENLKQSVDWTQKHIFPGSILPSIAAINNAVNQTGDLNLYQLHDMGQSYAHTLREWRTRFNSKISELCALGFEDTFIRKWQYYFSYCEAAFAMKNISVVQLLYSRPNNRLL